MVIKFSTILIKSLNIFKSLYKSSFLDNLPNNDIADFNISGYNVNLLSYINNVLINAYDEPNAILVRLNNTTPASDVNNLNIPDATYSFLAHYSLNN